jgi:hypothetical protein
MRSVARPTQHLTLAEGLPEDPATAASDGGVFIARNTRPAAHVALAAPLSAIGGLWKRGYGAPPLSESRRGSRQQSDCSQVQRIAG